MLKNNQLPSFLITGPPKCASTSLHFYLGQHPEIYTSRVKEINFFTHDYDKGLLFYESYFTDANNAKAIGEATPSYSFLPFVAERIKETLPDIKLIFCFRNPMERAFSHWLMLWDAGVEKASFSEAIQINFKQLEYVNFDGEEGAKLWNDRVNNIGKSEKWIRPYLHPGLYARSVNNYYDKFRKEQIKILFFDDLKNDFDKTMNDIFRFLGVNENFIVTERNEQNFYYNRKVYRNFINIFGVKATRYISKRLPKTIKKNLKPTTTTIIEKPAMQQTDRLFLWDVYKADVIELEKITGRNLSDWKPLNT